MRLIFFFFFLVDIVIVKILVGREGEEKII